MNSQKIWFGPHSHDNEKKWQNASTCDNDRIDFCFGKFRLRWYNGRTHLWHGQLYLSPAILKEQMHLFFSFTHQIAQIVTSCFVSYRMRTFILIYASHAQQKKKKRKKYAYKYVGLAWLDSIPFRRVFFSSTFHCSNALHFCTDLLAVGNNSRLLSCIVYDGSSPCDSRRSQHSLDDNHHHKHTYRHYM